MSPDPFLAEVTLRAWGTDDPRTLHNLRAENQPGTYRKTTVIGERAAKAGWPPPDRGIARARKHHIEVLKRLEGMGFDMWTLGDRSRRLAAYVSRSRSLTVEERDADTDDMPTIFDE